MNGNCFDVGYRTRDKYCSDRRAFLPSLEEGESCTFDYECFYDDCVSNVCKNRGLFGKIVSFLFDKREPVEE